MAVQPPDIKIRDHITSKLSASPAGRVLLVREIRINIASYLDFLSEICLSHVIPHRLPDFYRFKYIRRSGISDVDIIHNVEPINRSSKDCPKDLESLDRIVDLRAWRDKKLYQIMSKLYIAGSDTENTGLRYREIRAYLDLYIPKDTWIYLRSHLPLPPVGITQERKEFNRERYMREISHKDSFSYIGWSDPASMNQDIISFLFPEDVGHHYWLWKDLGYERRSVLRFTPGMSRIHRYENLTNRILSTSELLWRCYEDESMTSRDEKRAVEMIKRDTQEMIGEWYLYWNGALSLDEVKPSYKNISGPVRFGMNHCAMPFIKRGDHEGQLAELIRDCSIENIKFLLQHIKIPKDVIWINRYKQDLAVYLITEQGWCAEPLISDIIREIDRNEIPIEKIEEFLDKEYEKLIDSMDQRMMDLLAGSLVRYLMKDDISMRNRMLLAEKIFYCFSELLVKRAEEKKNAPQIDDTDKAIGDCEDGDRENITLAAIHYLAIDDKAKFMYCVGMAAVFFKDKKEEGEEDGEEDGS